MGFAASQPDKKTPQKKVPAHIQAMIDANNAEKAGPAGREMTYKEKKAAEKKKEEDAKRQKGENDAKLVPSKCKHCNAEIKDFWRWDRGDEDATPAFAK